MFKLVQLFTGPDCPAKFGTADENVCLNGYDIIDDPVSTIEVPLTDQYITVVPSDTQKSYQISGSELLRLMTKQTPAAGAPAGYEYVIFGYFITFKDGNVTRLEQWWTP